MTAWRTRATAANEPVRPLKERDIDGLDVAGAGGHWRSCGPDQGGRCVPRGAQ